MFVPARGSYPCFSSSAFPCPLLLINKNLALMHSPILILVLRCNIDQVGASQVCQEILLWLAFPLGAFGSTSLFLHSTSWCCETTYYTWLFKPLYMGLGSLPLEFEQAMSSFRWSPQQCELAAGKPCETNTSLVVLSRRSKWAQIGCKFNPDFETSANVLVNLIQPPGLFHPVSGFTVKSFSAPYMLPQ